MNVAKLLIVAGLGFVALGLLVLAGANLGARPFRLSGDIAMSIPPTLVASILQ